MRIKNYFASALDGMAKGLFASLIVGVIIKQIGDIAGIGFLTHFGLFAQYMMGPCIGLGIALKRECGVYTLIASAVAGCIGAGAIQALDITAAPIVYKIGVGEPVGAFAAALIGVEVGKFLEGKTKFDLFVVPVAVVLAAGFAGVTISPAMSALMRRIGGVVIQCTELAPVPMGILLGAAVGMALTLPISSAALCIAIQIGGESGTIAAGAALAGCCAQMIGFAVCSFKENKISGLLAQGIGTSMLQIPNIVKNPRIWIAPTIASGLGGLLSTIIFQMRTTSVGAGMGTAGLVGPIATYSVMGAVSLIPMLLLYIIIPAVVSLAISEFLYKISWIKPGDMRIQ